MTTPRPFAQKPLKLKRHATQHKQRIPLWEGGGAFLGPSHIVCTYTYEVIDAQSNLIIKWTKSPIPEKGVFYVEYITS